MVWLAERLQSMVCDDVDPDFIEAVGIAIAWEYDDLYTRLADTSGVNDDWRQEEFGRARGSCAVKALVSACTTFGVPYDFRRLACNGQSKLLVRTGRVIIVQEPILTLCDRPRASDYKRTLSETHGLVRQLELDLGDRARRVLDWSGCVLAVLLHGSALPRFDRQQSPIGGLFLALPDASYQQWVVRLDLHDLAIYGRRGPAIPSQSVPELQPETDQMDEVIVTSKRRRKKAAG